MNQSNEDSNMTQNFLVSPLKLNNPEENIQDATPPTKSEKNLLCRSSDLVQIQTEKFHVPAKKPWKPYETSHLEMPLFCFCFSFFYRIRDILCRLIRYPLFRFRQVEVSVGGVVFYLLLYIVFGYYGYMAFTSPRHRIKKLGYWISLSITVLFSISGRNSLWGFLLGISYERLAILHRVVTGVILGLTSMHAYLAYQKNNKQIYVGWTLAGLFVFIAVYSHVARSFNWYKSFLVLKRLAILIFIGCLVLHKANYAFIGIGMWFFDVCFRLIWIQVNKARVKVATAKLISDDVVEISFLKGKFMYAAGQYVFLTVPKVSFWEQHPFSISTAPYQKEVTLHIKAVGDWTRELAALCRAEQTLDIYLDGPYGSPSIEMDNPDKRIFVFIAGGIGVTPMLSMANNLLDQYIRGRPLHKLYFFWSFRDLSLAQGIIKPSSLLTQYHRDIHQIEVNCDALLKKEVLEVEFYFSSEKASARGLTEEKTDVDPPFQYLFEQKMNLRDIFERIQQEKALIQVNDVCVLSCGPESLMSEVSKMSKTLGFSHHLEVFNY